MGSTMSDADPGEDDELELEPIDPEILEHQRRRAVQKVREAEDAGDINEAYESVDQRDPISLEELKRFRFNTRHLLLLTAVVAVALSLKSLFGAFITFCAALAVAWWLVKRQEKMRLAEIDRHRRREIARTAARRAREDGEPPSSLPEEAFARVNDQWDASSARLPAFEFSFSLKQLFVALTVAAVVLGLVRMVGGPQNAALLLGLVALIGLVVQALGFDAPQQLVLGWWLILVLYILLSLAGVFSQKVAATEPLPTLGTESLVEKATSASFLAKRAPTDDTGNEIEFAMSLAVGHKPLG